MDANIEFEEHNYVEINIKIDDVSISSGEYEELAKRIYQTIGQYFEEKESEV